MASVTTELAAEWGLAPDLLPALPERALRLLRQRFVRDRSVRSLVRDLRALIGAALADGHGPARH